MEIRLNRSYCPVRARYASSRSAEYSDHYSITGICTVLSDRESDDALLNNEDFGARTWREGQEVVAKCEMLANRISRYISLASRKRQGKPALDRDLHRRVAHVLDRESLRCMLCRRMFHFSTFPDTATNCGSIARALQPNGGA